MCIHKAYVKFWSYYEKLLHKLCRSTRSSFRFPQHNSTAILHGCQKGKPTPFERTSHFVSTEKFLHYGIILCFYHVFCLLLIPFLSKTFLISLVPCASCLHILLLRSESWYSKIFIGNLSDLKPFFRSGFHQTPFLPLEPDLEKDLMSETLPINILLFRVLLLRRIC